VNVKSGRIILSRTGADGKHRFAALSSSGPVETDESWWIINQERDEAAYFIAELRAERSRVAHLEKEVAEAKHVSELLNQQLQESMPKKLYITASEAEKLKTQNALSKLLETEAAKSKLLQDVEAHRAQLLRLQAELLKERRSKEGLVAAQGKLAIELEEFKMARRELVDTLASMQNRVNYLSIELNATQQLNLEFASQVQLTQEMPEVIWPQITALEMETKLLATVLAVAFAAVIAVSVQGHLAVRSEIRVKRERIAVLENELHTEFGSTVSVGEFDGGLGTDFGFCIFNTEINQEAVRSIKVQCPGVKHADVEVELIFNGCEVTIRRQASRGVLSTVWKRSFQFKPSDGLFELREEQMMLEDGFLHLVFRACPFQNRLVLFPRHFSLSETDADACWDYAVNGEAELADAEEAWWREPEGGLECEAGASPSFANKPCSAADVDTESTASTARLLV
jgi:hypothetical protein